MASQVNMLLISFVFLFAFNSCQYFVIGDLLNEESAKNIQTPQANNDHDPVVGGRELVNISDPEVQQIAHFAVVELNKVSNVSSLMELIRIVSAERQVVEGIIHHLTLELLLRLFRTCNEDAPPTVPCLYQSNVARVMCEVSVLDTISYERKLHEYNCHQIIETSITTKRNNDHDAVVGGREPVNISDPEVQEIAQFSVVELNKVSNATNQKELIRIVTAERQVVAGLLHHLRLELRLFNNCNSDAPPTPEGSQQNNVARVMCEVSVLDTLISKERKLHEYKCTPIVGSTIRTKRNDDQDLVVRVRELVNISDPYVQNIAQYSVVKLNKVSNASNQKELIRIVSAERQFALAGLLHHLKLELRLFSTCNTDAPSTQECSQQNNVARVMCEVTVLYTRSRERKLHEYKCNPIVGSTIRTKRGFRA